MFLGENGNLAKKIRQNPNSPKLDDHSILKTVI
jgi:hypothetical protein